MAGEMVSRALESTLSVTRAGKVSRGWWGMKLRLADGGRVFSQKKKKKKKK